MKFESEESAKKRLNSPEYHTIKHMRLNASADG
ncbi:DUF1330 domain-containing protein [Desulfogranum marinum]|nr:DUF1330 domain-containing protein [Desulfogranum marinum]